MMLDSSLNIATPILKPGPWWQPQLDTPPPRATLCEYHCPFIFRIWTCSWIVSLPGRVSQFDATKLSPAIDFYLARC